MSSRDEVPHSFGFIAHDDHLSSANLSIVLAKALILLTSCAHVCLPNRSSDVINLNDI